MCVMIHQTQTLKSNSPKQMFVLGMAREELRISSGLSGKHLWSTFMYSCHFFFFFPSSFLFFYHNSERLSLPFRFCPQ